MTTYPRLCIGSFQKEFKIRYKTIVLELIEAMLQIM